MADRSGNIRAIIQLVRDIGGGLADVQRMKWEYALQKAKMSKAERMQEEQNQFMWGKMVQDHQHKLKIEQMRKDLTEVKERRGTVDRMISQGLQPAKKGGFEKL